jgi:hypothetical protein
MTAEAAAMDGVNTGRKGESGFNHRESLDAFRTERLLDHATTFHDFHFLEVRAKLAFRSFH